MRTISLAATLVCLWLSAGDAVAQTFADDGQAVAWYDEPGLGLEPAVFTVKNFGIALAIVLGLYFFRGGSVAGLVAWLQSFFAAAAPPPPPPLRVYSPPGVPHAEPAAPLEADTVLTLQHGRGRLVGPSLKTDFDATDPLEFRFAGRLALKVVPKE